MTRRKLRLFQITPDTIADPDQLGDALDRILVGDPGLRRNQRQIVGGQYELRALVDENQWHAYMVIEGLFNDRWARALDIVARQFYAAGRSARGRRK